MRNTGGVPPVQDAMASYIFQHRQTTTRSEFWDDRRKRNRRQTPLVTKLEISKDAIINVF